MTTRVVNVRHLPPGPWPADHVYIGRPNMTYGLAGSRWQNPHRIKPGQTRADAVAAYRPHLLARPDLVAALPDIRGKVLVCWCAPAGGLTAGDRPHVCHGQVLAELADAT